jgi:hypothetical protein
MFVFRISEDGSDIELKHCAIKETMSTTMHLFTFYLESDGMSTNNDYKHFFGALSLQFC